MARKLVCVALLLVLCACGSQAEEQVPQNTETFLPPTETSTPIPTNTATPEPTPSLTTTKKPSTTPTPTEVPAQFMVDNGAVKVWNPDTGVYDRDLVVPESVALKHKGEWNAETQEWSIEPARLDENGMPVFENPIYRTSMNENGEWETELLQINCLDEEVNDYLISKTLRRLGYSSIQSMNEEWINNGFDKNIYWGGFENGSSWYTVHSMKNVGGYIFSMDVNDGKNNDFSGVCALGVSPHYGGRTEAPLFIGYGNKENFFSTAYLSEVDLVSGENKSIDFKNIDEANEYINRNLGLEIMPQIVLRFKDANWDTDDSWSPFVYDDVLPLLKTEGNYIMNFSSDPRDLANLGTSIDWLGGTAERVFSEDVIEYLQEHQSTNFGLFVKQIVFYRK